MVLCSTGELNALQTGVNENYLVYYLLETMQNWEV